VEERLTRTQSRLRIEPTQLVVLVGIALLVGLTWLDLWRRASEMAMHEAMGMTMPSADPWDLGDLTSTAVMWGVMMVAMMLPSATPLLVLFARSQRPRLGPVEGAVRTGLVAAGYLVVWLCWSGLAATLQWGLHASLLLSPGAALTSAVAGGAVLIVAGLYQITPWKYTCLARCQSPLGFMLARWREGRGGAFRMGLAHGAYCVGCCWAIMGVLFVGGVMNMVWIAALAVLVLLEKVVRGLWVSYASAAVLVAWGLYVLRTGLLRAA
jgi:predicted metal-binding membrane protein